MAHEKLRPFIERPGSLLILDTSAFIEGEYFTDLDWHGLAGLQAGGPVRLIAPRIVIDELDYLKRDRRAGDSARSVLHRLWELRDGAGTAPAGLKGRRGVAPSRCCQTTRITSGFRTTTLRSSTVRCTSASLLVGTSPSLPEISECSAAPLR